MDASQQLLFPDSPILIIGLLDAVWLNSTGEFEELSHEDTARRLSSGGTPIVCHAPSCARRLNIDRFRALDVLELFAFVRPTTFCSPTPEGLARAMGLDVQPDAIAKAMALRQTAMALLRQLRDAHRDRDDISIAAALAHGGWDWAPFVLAALGEQGEQVTRSPMAGLDVWRRLSEWQDRAPQGEPTGIPVEPSAARTRLANILGDDAETRPSQADYASSASLAFNLREEEGAPNFVLAEAGTGVGKTLGYISPAGIWARRNGGTVWLSTYTKNLQRQIDQELDRMYPNPADKAEKVVVRKGRENYLCLLNFEEDASRAGLGGSGIALGLMARWAMATRDGDMTGGDFPAWLSHLFGVEHTIGLTDRRGECVYSACPHYRRCFIEIAQRKARYAELVIANHALVMI